MAIQNITKTNTYTALSTDSLTALEATIKTHDIKLFLTDTGEWKYFDIDSKHFVDDKSSSSYKQIYDVLTALGTVNSGVTVNTNAGKSSSTLTRPNNGDAYAAGDVVADVGGTVLSFANVLPKAGGQFVIIAVTLEIDAAAIPSNMGNFKLHLYSSAPTAIADNAPYNLPAADRDKYLGSIPLACPSDMGDTLWSQNDGLSFPGKLAAGSTTLYYMLTTDNAYTPSLSAVKKITIYTVGV